MGSNGFLNRQYSIREVRLGLRNVKKLRFDNDLRIDLESVYPLLGAEWRGVYDLYSTGYPLLAIAGYWANLHKGASAHRNYGNKLVRRLVDKILFYLGARIGKADSNQLATFGRVVAL